MTDEEWEQDFARCLGVYLAGDALAETDERGQPRRATRFLVLFNAHHEPIDFTLPRVSRPTRAGWRCSTPPSTTGSCRDGTFAAGSVYPLQGRSLALLQRWQRAQ